MKFLTSHRLRLAGFIGLNFVRFVTVVALLVGAAAQFVTLAVDLSVRTRDRNLNLGKRKFERQLAHPGLTSNLIPFTGTFDMYCPSTDIPGASGGTFGWTLSHILIALILIVSAIAELPRPPPLEEPLEQFWQSAFPSYSHSRGLQMVGVVMITFGSTELARNCAHFVRAAAWLLFVTGLLNLVIGFVLLDAVHFHRSLEAIHVDDGPAIRPNAATYEPKPKPHQLTIPDPIVPSRVHFALPSFTKRFSRQWSGSGQASHAPPSPSIYSNNDAREVRVDMEHARQRMWSTDDHSRLGPMIQIKPDQSE